MCAISPIFAQLQDIPQAIEGDYKKYKKAVVAAQQEADKEMIDDEARSSDEEVGKEWWADMSHSHVSHASSSVEVVPV